MNERLQGLTAQDAIDMLSLEPHPEGGFFKETFRDGSAADGRAFSTAIYYLLRDGEQSRWHRVDSAEIWHWYGGGTITLSIQDVANGPVARHVLGTDLSSGARPQVVVPPNAWQSASAAGAWTLVGCTVAPGFEFERFELAPENWSP